MRVFLSEYGGGGEAPVGQTVSTTTSLYRHSGCALGFQLRGLGLRS